MYIFQIKKPKIPKEIYLPRDFYEYPFVSIEKCRSILNLFDVIYFVCVINIRLTSGQQVSES